MESLLAFIYIYEKKPCRAMYATFDRRVFVLADLNLVNSKICNLHFRLTQLETCDDKKYFSSSRYIRESLFPSRTIANEASERIDRNCRVRTESYQWDDIRWSKGNSSLVCLFVKSSSRHRVEILLVTSSSVA